MGSTTNNVALLDASLTQKVALLRRDDERHETLAAAQLAAVRALISRSNGGA
jgi:ABC-type protease/lipase transport system fused ATPase/permease subunit